MLQTISPPRRSLTAALLCAALALLALGAGAARAETPAEQCSRLVRAEVAWNRAGARQWNPDNVRALCRGSRDAFATIDCFRQGVRRHDDWRRAIADCGGRQAEKRRHADPADVFAGYTRIVNRWHSNEIIHVERGRVEASAAGPGWHSARWAFEPVPGTSYVRLRNMWKPKVYLHIENGPLVAAPMQPGWWSGQWSIEIAPDGYRRIRNRWRPDHYLHVEHGRLEAGPIRPGWHSAMWALR